MTNTQTDFRLFQIAALNHEQAYVVHLTRSEWDGNVFKPVSVYWDCESAHDAMCAAETAQWENGYNVEGFYMISRIPQNNGFHSDTEF